MTDTPLSLRLVRDVPISPEQCFEGWTVPERLMPWFSPRPWRVVDCVIDLRPGELSVPQCSRPKAWTCPTRLGATSRSRRRTGLCGRICSGPTSGRPQSSPGVRIRVRAPIRPAPRRRHALPGDGAPRRRRGPRRSRRDGVRGGLGRCSRPARRAHAGAGLSTAPAADAARADAHRTFSSQSSASRSQAARVTRLRGRPSPRPAAAQTAAPTSPSRVGRALS